MSEKSKIRVGVVRGGISSEYEVSLKSGGHVLSQLRGEKLNHKYEPLDILIDREGLWHLNGLPVSLEKLSRSVDVILNALHGDFGEDGKIQQIFDEWNIPYTGSGAMASAIGYNKGLSKEQFSQLNIKTPQHLLIPQYQEDFDGPIHEYARRKAREVFQKLSPSWIIKPLTGGSSIGIHFCKTLPELASAFEDMATKNVSVIVEEMIVGKEATVGIVENFRGRDLYALPPIEIRPPAKSEFFDYEAKYSGESQEICPGNFSASEKKELEKLALAIHQGLGLSHYSRSDFIVAPKRGIYALEVNTLPGLTGESLLPKALSAVGSDTSEFIDHIIELALRKK